MGSKHSRFIIYLQNGYAWCVRTGGRGKRTYKKQTFLKSFPPKSSALEFLNLTLNAREARGTAKMHWLSLVGGKESQYQNASFPMSVPKVVTLRGIEPRFHG